MPSIDAPTHYERANHIMLDRFDRFFKYAVDGEDFVGSVDSPLGAVTLLNLTADDVRSIATDAAIPFGEYPSDGWFICRQNDDGLIWAMHYGFDVTFNEERARADYAEAEAVSSAWDEAEDQVEPDDMDTYWSGTGESVGDDSYIDYLNR